MVHPVKTGMFLRLRRSLRFACFPARREQFEALRKIAAFTGCTTKGVGFSLDEIKHIIGLGRHGKACGYVRDTLARHLDALDTQIAELTSLRSELALAQRAWQDHADRQDGLLCGLIEAWHASPDAAPMTTKSKELKMATDKRKVEVFTAGCPLCDPAVKLVKEVACEGCEVTVYNIKDDAQAAERAQALGVRRVPMVLIDGKPAECCTSSGAITAEGLRAAGIGAA